MSLSPSLALALVLVTLIGCRDPHAICADSGGGWDRKGKKCNCEITGRDGYCVTPALREIFESYAEDMQAIEIQRRGSGRRVELNGKRIEAEMHNGVEADFILAPSIGLFISIPDNPHRVSQPWSYMDCTFSPLSKSDLSTSVKAKAYAFSGVCNGHEYPSIFMTTENLNIVAFQLANPERSQFVNAKYKR